MRRRVRADLDAALRDLPQAARVEEVQGPGAALLVPGIGPSHLRCHREGDRRNTPLLEDRAGGLE